jgi:hypothetical protein
VARGVNARLDGSSGTAASLPEFLPVNAILRGTQTGNRWPAWLRGSLVNVRQLDK